jgi:hypothetical protein
MAAEMAAGVLVPERVRVAIPAMVETVLVRITLVIQVRVAVAAVVDREYLAVSDNMVRVVV